MIESGPEMIESGPVMIVYRPSITTMSSEMVAFLLEILICKNDDLHLRRGYLRAANDRRCCINDRVRQRNGSLQQENHRGCCTINRFRGGENRVVDRLDRRGNGNTSFAAGNDCR